MAGKRSNPNIDVVFPAAKYQTDRFISTAAKPFSGLYKYIKAGA